MPIAYEAIYPRLKGYLANKAGFDSPDSIYADWTLTDHPLLYDVRGKRGLASALNELFPKPPRKQKLEAAQTEKAESVRDLAKLIRQAHK